MTAAAGPYCALTRAHSERRRVVFPVPGGPWTQRTRFVLSERWSQVLKAGRSWVQLQVL